MRGTWDGGRRGVVTSSVDRKGASNQGARVPQPPLVPDSARIYNDEEGVSQTPAPFACPCGGLLPRSLAAAAHAPLGGTELTFLGRPKDRVQSRPNAPQSQARQCAWISTWTRQHQAIKETIQNGSATPVIVLLKAERAMRVVRACRLA